LKVKEAWPDPRVREDDERVRALQPHARLADAGPAGLTVAELLSVIAGGGRRHLVEASCRTLLAGEGLARIARFGVDDWAGVDGIGRAGACRIVAALELRRRAGEERRATIDGPRAAWRQVRALGRARKEHLVGIYLDAQNSVIHRETISIGSLNTTRTHPREILYPAVRHLALAFILAHNHPSGCPDPSTEDVEFTAAIRRAAELFGIELYDHLIVAGDGFTSLRERGLL
jgi:DNA repair protein RadC